MKKPTPDKIAAEIAALKKLKPIGPFARKTAATIQIQIDALEDNIDPTADEFTGELTEEQQSDALDALNWKDGVSKDKPSEGWGELVSSARA